MSPVRGDGRVFLRGSRWWIAYYARHHGHAREFREPARIVERQGENPRAARTEQEARRALRLRLREVLGDRWVAPEERRVTVSEVVLRQDRTPRALRSDPAASARPGLAAESTTGDTRAIHLAAQG